MGTNSPRSLSVVQASIPLASDMIYISVTPKLQGSFSASLQLWAECKCAFDTYLNRCHNSFPELLNHSVTWHLCCFPVQKQSTLAFIDAFVLWYIIHHSATLFWIIMYFPEDVQTYGFVGGIDTDIEVAPGVESHAIWQEQDKYFCLPRVLDQSDIELHCLIALKLTDHMQFFSLESCALPEKLTLSLVFIRLSLQNQVPHGSW